MHLVYSNVWGPRRGGVGVIMTYVVNNEPTNPANHPARARVLHGEYVARVYRVIGYLVSYQGIFSNPSDQANHKIKVYILDSILFTSHFCKKDLFHSTRAQSRMRTIF